eukprot:scaffold11344_cov56-Phaeocystis_antarctica.AAC.3
MVRDEDPLNWGGGLRGQFPRDTCCSRADRHLQLPVLERRVNVHPHLYGIRLVARIQLDVLPERAPRVVPRKGLRIAVSQHSVAVLPGPTAVGTDVSPVDQEHWRIVPVLHDKVPVPVAAGVRRLEQDHCRGGVVKRGRVRPLQQEFAARVAQRVLVGGRVPID